MVCHEIPDEIHTCKNNTANKLPQSVFSTAENGETKGQHPEMDQRDHHVCHVIKGVDEATLKSNAVKKILLTITRQARTEDSAEKRF